MSGAEVKDVKDAKEVKDTDGKRGPIRHYKDLLIYQQAYRLAVEVSKLVKTFPRHEQYDLGRQLRRSARSVVANIVEGWSKRNSPADFKRHLIIAKGEAAECECWSELAADENLAERERCLGLHREYGKLGMMIHNLWKEWRNLQGKASPSPPSHPAPPSPLL